MTPSHAVKNRKRYRYYVSNDLIAGANGGRGGDRGTGLRIPAQEIEGHVVAAISMFLADARRVIAEFCPGGTSPVVASAAVRKALMFGEKLRAEDSGTHYETVRSMVERVQVRGHAICMTLNRQSLAERLGIPIEMGSLDVDSPLELTMTAELRRLGKEKRLIVAALAPETNPDAVLIKAVVRAHQWFEMLKSRSVESITDIAKAERLPRTYVGSVIRFALLAPDIIEAILAGTQPIDLNLDRLISGSLPIEWGEQRAVLGFK